MHHQRGLLPFLFVTPMVWLAPNRHLSVATTAFISPEHRQQHIKLELAIDNPLVSQDLRSSVWDDEEQHEQDHEAVALSSDIPALLADSFWDATQHHFMLRRRHEPLASSSLLTADSRDEFISSSRSMKPGQRKVSRGCDEESEADCSMGDLLVSDSLDDEDLAEFDRVLGGSSLSVKSGPDTNSNRRSRRQTKSENSNSAGPSRRKSDRKGEKSSNSNDGGRSKSEDSNSAGPNRRKSDRKGEKSSNSNDGGRFIDTPSLISEVERSDNITDDDMDLIIQLAPSNGTTETTSNTDGFFNPNPGNLSAVIDDGYGVDGNGFNVGNVTLGRNGGDLDVGQGNTDGGIDGNDPGGRNGFDGGDETTMTSELLVVPSIVTVTCSGTKKANQDSMNNREDRIVPVVYRYEADIRGDGGEIEVLSRLEEAIVSSMKALLPCAETQRERTLRDRKLEEKEEDGLKVIAAVAKNAPSFKEIEPCTPTTESPNQICRAKRSGFALFVQDPNNDAAARDKVREEALSIIKTKALNNGYLHAHERLIQVRIVDVSSSEGSTRTMGGPVHNAGDNVDEISAKGSGDSKPISPVVWGVVAAAFLAVAILLERVHKRKWRQGHNSLADDDSVSDFSSLEHDVGLLKGGPTMAKMGAPVSGSTVPIVASEKTLQIQSEKSLLISETSSTDGSLVDETFGLVSPNCSNALPPLSHRSLDEEDGGPAEEGFLNGSHPSLQTQTTRLSPKNGTSSNPTNHDKIGEDDNAEDEASI